MFKISSAFPVSKLTCLIIVAALVIGSFPLNTAKADITTGLMGYWRFDEGSGTAASDSASGNGAVLNNGTLWTSGKLGSALAFDGVDDYLSISNGPNFGTGSFTYSLWVNVNQNVGGYDMPWFKGGACAGCPGYDMELGTDGWAAHLSDTGTNSAAVSLGSEVLNAWTLLTVVVDRSNNLFRAYQNNSLIESVSIAGFGSVTSPYQAKIGGDAPHFFKGSIDDVRVYSRALSTNDVVELYNAGQVQGDTTPPVISSVSASSITSSSAVINFSTNEPADTQVDYGTSISYGSQTSLNSSFVTSHAQSIFGLNPNTTYNYRVRSRDAAGNLAISANNTFTTSTGTTPPPSPGNQLPIGYFDSASNGIISGWSVDLDASGSSNTIQIFFNGPVGAGTLISSFPTNVLRSDVNTDYAITGSHGYNFTIPTAYQDGVSHPVYVYAIDINDASKSTLLTGSPKSFILGGTTPPPPNPTPTPSPQPTGPVYYVAPSNLGGNDSNPGSIGSPFRTIAKGLSIMQPGYTLYIRGGSYAEKIGYPAIIPSGTAANYITIKAYPGEAVTVRPGGGEALMDLSGTAYLIFDGFIFDAANAGVGLSGNSSPHHIKIMNSEVKNSLGDGLSVAGNFFELINLNVHHNAVGTGNHAYHGVYFSGANDSLIDGGRYYDNGGYGIQVNGWGAGDVLKATARNTVRNTLVYDNGFEQPGGGGGIVFSAMTEGNVMYNNVVYNNIGVGIQLDGSNNFAYNNTIYGSTYGILFWYDGYGNIANNNISYSNTNNIHDLAPGHGNVNGINNLTSNPSFANAGATDFRLTSQSTNAIDKGTDLSNIFRTDFTGATRTGLWDIGAYEMGGVITPPPPQPGNQLPVGFFDSASNGTISGWSFDPDLSGSSNTVQIYFNGPVGTGSLISSFPTNVLRSDVNNDYGITGNHGFNFTIPTAYHDGLSHSVYVYAIDINDASKSTLLFGSPRNFTLNPVLNPDTTAPTASITSPSAGTVSGTITYSATASDPTVSGQVNSGLSLLSLFIDGSLYATTTTSSISRSLSTLSLANGNHALTARAQDNAGNQFTTSAITINVNNAPAQKFPRTITLSSLEGLSAIPANQSITISIMSGSTVLRTQTLTPNASKQYTVTFQASDPQIVDVRVSVNKYLSRKLTSLDTTLNSATVITVPQLLAGDLNNDNSINTLDYSILNVNWNQTSTTADINGDGFVNSLDYAILKNNFSRVGE